MRCVILVSLVICTGCGDFQTAPRNDPPKTVAEEFNIDCSKTAQAERRRIMLAVGEEGLFSRFEYDGPIVICWTGQHWSGTPFDVKEKFVNMIFAWTCCGHPEADFPLVVVRDQFSGKDVATFTKGRGLVMK